MTSRAENGRKALIAGAGIGGLAAAAALAPHFGQVVVFERDKLPKKAEFRTSVSQGAHVHALLRGGEACLGALLPGIRDDFIAAGATVSRIGLDYRIFDYGAWRPRRDLGSTIVCMSRPGYEHVIRARVRALPNVRIEEGARVERIAFEAGAAIGLAVKRGEDIGIEHGDFIVDARGRGGALARELDEAGWPIPAVDIVGIDLSYATARFKKPAAHKGSPEIIGCMPTPPDKRYGLLFPIEGDEWIVSLSGRGEVVPPTDIDGFLDFAGRLAIPDIRERLDGAELAAPIRGYKKPTASWRRYDALERFPRRLALVGDVIASINPIFGQGMTVAAREAAALRDTLDILFSDEAAFSSAYFARAAQTISEAWTFASSVDLAYTEVSGERPSDFEMQQALRFGLRWLADEDAEIHRLAMDISQMARPFSDLRNVSIIARALAKAREKGAVPKAAT